MKHISVLLIALVSVFSAHGEFLDISSVDVMTDEVDMCFVIVDETDSEAGLMLSLYNVGLSVMFVTDTYFQEEVTEILIRLDNDKPITVQALLMKQFVNIFQSEDTVLLARQMIAADRVIMRVTGASDIVLMMADVPDDLIDQLLRGAE